MLRWAFQETGTAAYTWALIFATWKGYIPLAWIAQFYAIVAGILLINHLRTLAAHRYKGLRLKALWWFTAIVEIAIFVSVVLGIMLVKQEHREYPKLHTFYGFVAIITVAQSSNGVATGEHPVPANHQERERTAA